MEMDNVAGDGHRSLLPSNDGAFRLKKLHEIIGAGISVHVTTYPGPL